MRDGGVEPFQRDLGEHPDGSRVPSRVGARLRQLVVEEARRQEVGGNHHAAAEVNGSRGLPRPGTAFSFLAKHRDGVGH